MRPPRSAPATGPPSRSRAESLYWLSRSVRGQPLRQETGQILRHGGHDVLPLAVRDIAPEAVEDRLDQWLDTVADLEWELPTAPAQDLHPVHLDLPVALRPPLVAAT